MGNMGYKSCGTPFQTYTTNYELCCGGVRYTELHEPQVFLNRILRFHLGVNKFTPNPAVKLEMDVMDSKMLHWIEFVRLKNHISSMDENRLPVKVYKWDESLKINGWVTQLKSILEYANMSECAPIDVQCDLDVLQTRLHRLNRDKWWVEASSIPKLRTFIEIHDITESKVLVLKNFKRTQRSLLAKLKMWRPTSNTRDRASQRHAY